MKMTLKEITDLLEVNHDEAISVVEKMGLGTVTLTQRQSLAVSARLNAKRLVRVINYWKRINQNNLPTTFRQLRFY